jgi:DNA-binding MarR family transcriptional regulator
VQAARYDAGVTAEHELGEQVADAIGQLLRRSARAGLYRELTVGLDPAVNEATYPVISGLARTGPATAAGLAAEIGIDRSVASRHATRLEGAGLLRREPDPSDRRGTLLVLTPEGERLVAVMRGRLAGAVGRYLASWPPSEAAAFTRSLRRFTEHGPWSAAG